MARTTRQISRSISAAVVTAFPLIALAGLLIAPSASAMLVEGDLFAAGDGRVTIDQATGLEWLDLTETDGDSYNQVLSSSFVTQDGFRYATRAEVETFLGKDHANFAEPLAGGWLEADKLPATQILDLMGCTGDCDTGRNPFAQGLTAALSDASAWAGQSFKITANFDGDISNPLSEATRGDAARSLNKLKTAGDEKIGSFLVRVGTGGSTPVPEPSAALLFGAGVLVVRTSRLRRPS